MTNHKPAVMVAGGFDDIRSRQVRLLHVASGVGSVHVLLWDDATVERLSGRPPKFPQAERLYYTKAIRFVEQVHLVNVRAEGNLPAVADVKPQYWVTDCRLPVAGADESCRKRQIKHLVLTDDDVAGFPEIPPAETSGLRKKVVVTGCFDWFHSGHVRFLEEVSELGDVYAIVGHDENLRLLKGPGRPMFRQEERRYMIAAVRYVKEALISTGHGWMDAEPEVLRIRPDIYAVNEDGDHPDKQRFCERHGIEYRVLRRLPRPGLDRRTSTDLRGF